MATKQANQVNLAALIYRHEALEALLLSQHLWFYATRSSFVGNQFAPHLLGTASI